MLNIVDIKYCIYIGLIISFMKQSCELVIFFLFCLILLQIGIIKIKRIDKLDKEVKCRKSTIDNPMGNILLYTSIEEMDQKVCKLSDNEINKKLRYNVYNDSTDLFLKKNNVRPYITMPSQTHPNEIDKYKKYIYYSPPVGGNNPSCKINGLNCMYNKDIRYHKT